MSCSDKSPEKPESGSDEKPPDKPSKTIPVLIDRTTSSSECPNATNMDLYSKQTVKNQSWASNYLQSIGLTYDKTIFKRKIKMNSSQDSSSNFPTQDLTATIDLTNATPNVTNTIPNVTNLNYNNVCNPSIASHGDNVSYTNYSNIAPNMQIQATMPGVTYTNPYVNDINSYYFNQAKGNVVNSEFPIIYYNPVTSETVVNANLSTTYSNALEHSMTNVTSNLYYNTNEPSQSVDDNLLITYPSGYVSTYYNQNNNYYGQKSDMNENDMIASATLCSNVNNVQITTADSNLQTLNPGGYDNTTNANSSTVFNESNVKKLQNTENKTQQSNSSNINEKKYCDCLCIKLNQEKEQIKENKNKRTKELEQECLSKVQENERKFRDFLKKLNLKSQSEQEKNQNKNVEKCKEDMTVNKKRKLTDSQQSKKKYPKLIKKKKVGEQEPTRDKKRIEIAKKTNTKLLDRKYSDEQEQIMNKKSREFRQNEKMGQLLQKTKCVNEKQSGGNRKRREIELDDKTRPKFIKTKYVDDQEPIYEPPKKPRIDDFEIKNYTNPECHALNKVKIDSKCIKQKSETRIPKSEKDLSPKNEKRDDCSYKVKMSKTEATKYYKCKSKDCDETTKTSPEKCYINTPQKRELNKFIRHDIPENRDLRDVLCRKLQKKENVLKNKVREHEIPRKKSSDVLNDNLVITVNNDISEIEKSPENISNKKKSKRETHKKINLVINILYKQPSSQSESDKSDCDDHFQANSDLSFLDEIDVDEIVESLSKSEKIGVHKNSISDEPNKISNGPVPVNETQNINEFIKKENTEIDRVKLTGNGDALNNLLLKEASLLDSLRLVHQEIETEKRVLKEENRMFEDKTHSLVPISNLLERIKKHGTNDTDGPCKEHPPTEHTKLSNIKSCTPLTPCHSGKDIVHDKQIQHIPEISNLIENKEDKQEATKTDILGENLDATTLTFCHEDIVHNKQINLPRISNKLQNDKEDKRELIKEAENLGENLIVTNLTLWHSGEDSVHDKQIKNLPDISYMSQNNKQDKQEPIKEIDNSGDNLNVTNLTLGHSSKDIVHNKQIKNVQKHSNKSQNNKQDNQKSIKEIIILDNDFNVTTIDLSNDDSNDYNKMDETTLKTIIHKEQTLASVTKDFNKIPQIVTIDLTTDDTIDNNRSVLNDALKEIQRRIENEIAEKTIPVDKTIINNSCKVVNEELQPKKETIIESNISRDNGFEIRGSIMTNINNDTYSVIDTNIIEEDTIETFAINTTKGKLQDINTKDISNIQTTKTQNDINTETEVSKPPVQKYYNTKVKEDIAVITFKNVAFSDSKTVNDDSSDNKLDFNEKENEHACTLEFETKTTKPISKDCNTHVIGNNSVNKYILLHNVANIHTEKIKNKEDNDKKVSQNQNVSPLNLKCVKPDETVSIDMNSVNVSETVVVETQLKEKNAKNSEPNTILDEKNEKQINETFTGETRVKDQNAKGCDANPNIKISDDKNEKQINKTLTGETQVKEKNTRDCDPNPNIEILDEKDKKIQIKDIRDEVKGNEIKAKSDSINTQVIPSPTSKLNSSPSASSKKHESNGKISSIKIGDINKKSNPTMQGMVAKIAARLERQMLKCFDEEFTVVNLIHSGTFSKIFHCRNTKVGNDYAVKSLNSSSSLYKNREQSDLLFGLQSGISRNCPWVYLLNTFALHGHLCLFTDYYPKNLEEALAENGKPFHINVVQHLARQLVSAVISLKDQDIVHLDINPRHILLNHTNSQLKLCGFDEARKIRDIVLLSIKGTLNYRPPESIICANPIGFGVDVWATGLVLYEMATNIQLFPGTTCNDVLFKQMCTLGALPIEMIYSSLFGYKYFTGSNFKRVMGVGYSKKINIITKFFRSGRLESTIAKAYNVYWRPKASKQALSADVDKTMFLTSLLREMLQVNPTERINIQGVNAHAFISDY